MYVAPSTRDPDPSAAGPRRGGMYVVPSTRDPDRSSAAAADGEAPRVYEVWKGSNKFFLGGRFIFGPDARSLFLTMFLIIVPMSIFCVFVARKLMDDFYHHSGISIMVIAVAFTLYDIALLLLTSGRDPGITPRNAHPPEPEGYDGNTEVGGSQTPHLRLPRMRDVVVNGITVKIKYCDTCMLYRPPRCSHCSVCNNCVERFDHHCPWVGQCIGLTTYENFRYRYDRRDNPYNRGVVANFKEIFFTSIPPSKNKFRARAPQEQGFQSRSLGGGFISPNMGIPVGDLEMGRKPGTWDEARIGADVNDLQGLSDTATLDGKNGGFGDASPDLSRQTSLTEGLQGHAALHPRRPSWGHRSASWEMPQEVLALAAGAGESNQAGRGKVSAGNQ
ncbi:probable protein S-acyltransferase 7 isoform X2 [Phoenix dactylifera]|uniref:S-acyltransferase n=1 Tax=Phoenix dactylifera TaxID=42345 RepID=A0A8B9ALZ5_PHODC|nr:probable protein S-acyltransferase 7 isoform X2 [Phoenix dactylifera]